MASSRKRFYLIVAVSLLAFIWLAGCDTEEDSGPTAEPTPNPTATPRPTPTPLYEPVFETAGCQFPVPSGVELECGYLIVPEDRANPERTIRLHIAIVPSASDAPAPDPMVYLSGGPGGRTLNAAGYYVQLFRDVLKERDVILFDQRGIGYSEPSLNCPEYEEAWLAHIEERLDDDERLAITLEAFSVCRERLVADGVNLSAYNSAASAADLEDLRQALGYETLNLLGISYGTRLALTAMRDYGHTSAIRSVILDSVYPPQVDGYAVLGMNADRAFDLLFERCAAIEQCNEDYPDLENRFYQLVDTLNADPMTVVITDRANRTTLRIPFDGDDLINTFFEMMYDNNRILYLPKMIRQIENGVSSILIDYLTNDPFDPVYFSEGMHYSVQCYEEMPFSLSAEEQTNAGQLPPQLNNVVDRAAVDDLALCELWQVETAEPLENEPVVSDVPTLILAGDYDPITPPSNAMETAEYLSNDFYFEFEGISHGVVGSTDCGMDLVVAFLDQPDTVPDDTCLESLYFGFVPP